MYAYASNGGLREKRYRKHEQYGSLITKVIVTRLKYLVVMLWNTGSKKKSYFLVKDHLVTFSHVTLFLISPSRGI